MTALDYHGDVLRLVTTNNVQVFRHLGSAAFQRYGLTYKVVSSYDQALDQIRELRPDVAILDDELAGGSGFDLCRALKDDPELSSTHVMLLLSSVLDRTKLERIQASGCDDVLALPIQADEFYHHIAQLAGLPIRRHHRVGITLELVLPNMPKPVVGSVFNVSPVGLGGQVPMDMHEGMTVHFRLSHDGEVTPDGHGVVTWVEKSEGKCAFGLSLDEELPIATQLLLERLSLFDVAPAPKESPMHGGVTVALQGDFNELTRFKDLSQRLASENRIDFNVSAVRYISSAGVRSWCQFLAGLEGKQYLFRHCSMAFAAQAAMVPLVVGSGEVLSLEAPYLCEECEREELRLLEVKSLLVEGKEVVPPRLTCHACGGELLFDDIPRRYFAFLNMPE